MAAAEPPTPEPSTTGAPPPETPGDAGPPPPGRAPTGWRRPTAITLVILGGVTAVGLTTCESAEARCERLRAERHPDAAAACAETRTTSGGSSGGSYSSGGGGGTAGAGLTTPITRGGFGGTARGFFSGGG